MQQSIQSYQSPDPFGPNNQYPFDSMSLLVWRMQCLVIATFFAVQLRDILSCLVVLLFYWITPGVAVSIIKRIVKQYLTIEA